LSSDLVAGATTWVLLVPQAMAYALLAGLPPEVGLYTAVIPLFAYALLGTSRQVAIGPVAIDSMMVASAIGALGLASRHDALAAAVALTLMVGLAQVVMGLIGAGFIANFLSRPVQGGFTSAAALVIASTQMGPLFGIKLRQDSLFRAVSDLAGSLANLHVTSSLMGVAALLALVMLKVLAPKFPRALAVLALATLLCAVLALDEQGLAIVGTVPAGLPTAAMSSVDWFSRPQMWGAALPIALVSFVESLSSGRTLARRARYEIVPNRELVALGAANVSSSLFGGYVVAGGLSRSTVNADAGAKSQLAALVTAALVALTLLLLTPYFYYLPKPALAAVVLAAVASLIDVGQVKRLWRVKRTDFWLLAMSFAATLAFGMQLGLLLGVSASIALFVIRATRPHMAILGRLPGSTVYRNQARFPSACATPGILILRIDAQFYFGNVTFLKDTVTRLLSEHSDLKAIVLDASGMNELDSSALEALQELERDLGDRRIALYLAHVKGPVRDVMERAGWLERLRTEKRVFHRVHDAVLHASGACTPEALASSETNCLPPCVGELANKVP
jgi:SulP family sulfate permease